MSLDAACWDESPCGDQSHEWINAIVKEGAFFFNGQELASTDGAAQGQRFLSTVECSSSLVVFAYQPPDDGVLGKGYGTHVSKSHLVAACKAFKWPEGAGAYNPTWSKMPELTKSLKAHFARSKDVRVTVVGGRRDTDVEPDLKAFFPKNEEMWSFSWHILNAIADAQLGGTGGGSEVADLSRLMPWQGDGSPPDADPPRDPQDTFHWVSLDLQTGKVYTHAKEEVKGTGASAHACEYLSPAQRHAERQARDGAEDGRVVDVGKLCGHRECMAGKERLEASKRCAKCKVAMYCSVECQKEAWSIHKKWCVKAR